jgi:hypothetical protein
MGCGWTPRVDVDYSRVQGVEAVNGIDADTSFSGIPFWERLLERGYRLTAVGGSDNHNALQQDGNVIGTPTTVVYADELSQTGIIAGIRRGRVFIDVAGTHNRTLDLTATAGSQIAHMGETLTLARGARVRFEGSAGGIAAGSVEMIVDGRRIPLGSAAQAFVFPWRADGKQHWMRVDVRDDASHLALVGNPIYIRARRP